MDIRYPSSAGLATRIIKGAALGRRPGDRLGAIRPGLVRRRGTSTKVYGLKGSPAGKVVGQGAGARFDSMKGMV